jgi:hypothetical protein
LLKRVLAWAEHCAAVGFLMVVAVVVLVCAAKALTRQRATDIYRLLRGEKTAVWNADRERWEELERQAAAKALVEVEEQIGSGLAREALEQEKKRLSEQLKKEQDYLGEINAVVAKREGDLLAAQKKLAQDEKQFNTKQDALLAAAKDANLKKALKLYASMDAETIAKDFEAKLKVSNAAQAAQAREEVVKILRNMPERQAGEVLSAIQNGEVRNELMDLIRS